MTQDSQKALTDTIPVMEWQIILSERNKDEMHAVSICPKNEKKELITEDIYETMALWSLSPKRGDLEMFSVKDNKHFKKYYFTNKRQTSEDQDHCKGQRC